MPATLSRTKRTSGTLLVAGDGAERLAERGGVGRPGVGRRLHAAQQHGEVPLAGGADDGGQVLLQLVGRQAAQAIVAAELDDQHTDVAVERPVEAAQAARRGVPRDAGVDDLEVEALAIDALLEPGRERLIAPQAVAGRDAVAEHHQPGPRGHWRGRGGGGRRIGWRGGSADAVRRRAARRRRAAVTATSVAARRPARDSPCLSGPALAWRIGRCPSSLSFPRLSARQLIRSRKPRVTISEAAGRTSPTGPACRRPSLPDTPGRTRWRRRRRPRPGRRSGARSAGRRPSSRGRRRAACR